MKNRVWIIIFSLVIIICAVCFLFISNSSSCASIVGIYQNGKLVERIDLNSITEEKYITLKGNYGKNVIYVSNGHIKMQSADCPDKICVKHGELKNSASPIVCLPNEVIIKFEDNTDKVDAKTGALK